MRQPIVDSNNHYNLYDTIMDRCHIIHPRVPTPAEYSRFAKNLLYPENPKILAIGVQTKG
jgi:hypothetical protein